MATLFEWIVAGLVVAGAGMAGGIDPSVMRADPGHFHVLELGKIEDGLAKIGSVS